jgi:hypothetical protein
MATIYGIMWCGVVLYYCILLSNIEYNKYGKIYSQGVELIRVRREELGFVGQEGEVVE